MNALFITLAVLVMIAAILLTLVVLLQNGKGGGMASNFVAGNATFGVRETTNILEKITWGLAVVILVLSVVSSFMIRGSKKDAQNEAQQMIEETEATAENAGVPEMPMELINPEEGTESAN